MQWRCAEVTVASSMRTFPYPQSWQSEHVPLALEKSDCQMSHMPQREVGDMTVALEVGDRTAELADTGCSQVSGGSELLPRDATLIILRHVQYQDVSHFSAVAAGSVTLALALAFAKRRPVICERCVHRACSVNRDLEMPNS